MTGLHLSGALATAEQLFRSAGIHVRWRRSIPGGENPPQFTLVLTSRFDRRLHASLGPCHVGIFLRDSRRAYVMYDRVVDMSRRYRASTAAMLGWALAHEVGHLLLGDEHAPSGVMAVRLTPARLLEQPFSPEQRGSLRANAALLGRPEPTRLAGAPEQPAADDSSAVDRTD